MGTLAAVVSVEQSRDLLQKPANYLVNTTKQYVYTMNETHMTRIQDVLPAYTVIYIGRDQGFNLSGVPLGGENYILAKLQENLDKTKEVIANTQEINVAIFKIRMMIVDNYHRHRQDSLVRRVLCSMWEWS